MNLKFGDFSDSNSSDPVPSYIPETDTETRIAIVGGFPNASDHRDKKPLYDASGKVFRAILQSHGISPLQVMIGYTCRYYPPNGRISAFNRGSMEVHDSHRSLREELAHFKPNVILLLGDYALSAAGVRGVTVEAYRGTRFMCDDTTSPFYGYKCLATFTPGQVSMKYDRAPLQSFDIQRTLKESLDPVLVQPKRSFDIHLTAEQVIERMDAIPSGSVISIDIEGYINKMTCCSISMSPDEGFIVAFIHYAEHKEGKVWRSFAKLMERADVGKVLQNGMYDNFVMAWSYGILIRNIVADTMLSGWEIYPELPKGLGTQSSIWTDEPYWKNERTVADDDVHHEYCCKDAAVTLEIALEHQRFFQETGDTAALAHYKFNVSLLSVLMYMQLKGMNYDKERSDEFLKRVRVQMHEIQVRLDTRRKKPLNVNSPKQVCTFLYTELCLPTQYAKVGNKFDRTKPTANLEACLALYKKFSDPVVQDILAWRKLDKLRQQLEVETDADGRVRGSYNIVGTKTGRLSSSKSPTGTGANLQTITKAVRKVYRADPGFEFFQLDLAGADGWTVAAHCSRLGDDTMMDDYKAGLKPAKIIALMYRHGVSISRLSREELLIRCREVDETDPEHGWIYAASKAVQHGTNYQMGAQTVSATILKGSYKNTGRPIYVPVADCKRLQALYNQRYPGVRAWHRWAENELRVKGRLTAASGCTRRFFGRRNDNVTLRDFLSHEPQANTTYATNLAMHALWNDPENRREDGTFIIEPLHQVHDAVCGQWPVEVRAWAIKKLYSYFDNTLTIAGIDMVIPFDGEYGASWGEIYNTM